MSIHVLYDHDHVWADIESQSFILLIPLFLLFELFIRAKLFHPSLPYSSCPFSLTKRNTFSNPSSYPSPQLILSCPHSLLFTYSFLSFHCPHLLPLSDPLPFSSSFFPLFLWSTAPYAFSLSFFNLDFHHTLFCLFRSDCLSFYFFWWQSVFFTSPLSHAVSLHCLGLSLFPWLTDSWFFSISIPPGWLDSTMCRVSPHQKANNEKRNVWRNPAVSLHVTEEVEEG